MDNGGASGDEEDNSMGGESDGSGDFDHFIHGQCW